MNIIENILQLMKQNNVTAAALTRATELNHSAVDAWKNGKAKPSAEALAKIADYFDVTVDYLMGRPEKDPAFIHYRTGYKNILCLYDKSGDVLTYNFDNSEYDKIKSVIEAITKK